MKPLPLLGVAIVFLVAAVRATPRSDAPAGANPLQQVGRTLGGVRVLASDVLFLRADRLRAEGRYEEVPALYAAVQDLEPDNPAAADFLVAVQAFDLLADAPDGRVRRARWDTAWDLLQRARARYPDDPSLMVREADLLLEVPTLHPDLVPAIDERVPDRALRALRLLLRAAEATPTLPRRGRHHILVLTELVPVLAYQHIQDGTAEDYLAIGERLLALRPRLLAAMPVLTSKDDGETFATVPRDRFLRLGIDAVREIMRRGPSAIPEVKARLAEVVPDAPLLRVMGGP